MFRAKLNYFYVATKLLPFTPMFSFIELSYLFASLSSFKKHARGSAWPPSRRADSLTFFSLPLCVAAKEAAPGM